MLLFNTFSLQSLIQFHSYSENFQVGSIIDLKTRNTEECSELPVNSKMMCKYTVKYCDFFAIGKCLVPLLRLMQI